MKQGDVRAIRAYLERVGVKPDNKEMGRIVSCIEASKKPSLTFLKSGNHHFAVYGYLAFYAVGHELEALYSTALSNIALKHKCIYQSENKEIVFPNGDIIKDMSERFNDYLAFSKNDTQGFTEKLAYWERMITRHYAFADITVLKEIEWSRSYKYFFCTKNKVIKKHSSKATKEELNSLRSTV